MTITTWLLLALAVPVALACLAFLPSSTPIKPENVFEDDDDIQLPGRHRDDGPTSRLIPPESLRKPPFVD